MTNWFILQRIELLRWTQFTPRAQLALRIMCMSSTPARVAAATERI